jgi:hypothetical protein
VTRTTRTSSPSANVTVNCGRRASSASCAQLKLGQLTAPTRTDDEERAQQDDQRRNERGSGGRTYNRYEFRGGASSNRSADQRQPECAGTQEAAAFDNCVTHSVSVRRMVAVRSCEAILSSTPFTTYALSARKPAQTRVLQQDAHDACHWHSAIPIAQMTSYSTNVRRTPNSRRIKVY